VNSRDCDIDDWPSVCTVQYTDSRDSWSRRRSAVVQHCISVRRWTRRRTTSVRTSWTYWSRVTPAANTPPPYPTTTRRRDCTRSSAVHNSAPLLVSKQVKRVIKSLMRCY